MVISAGMDSEVNPKQWQIASINQSINQSSMYICTVYTVCIYIRMHVLCVYVCIQLCMYLCIYVCIVAGQWVRGFNATKLDR